MVVQLDQSLPVPSRDGRAASPRWRPRIEHPLQPAIHFRGRTALREQLGAWWSAPNHGTHVVSLVAAGGTGKTALIERFLRDVRASLPGGLFVWSFYEDPRTEAFLRTAAEYFARVMPSDPLACLHHVQEVLGSGAQHLVVLDGIELVQEPFQSTRPLGTLRDPLLKRLLRSIADGLGGARAMITSRFPLPDLQSWEDEQRRHWPISLESLDEDAAVALFIAWGVRGERADLVALGRQLGFHALSIAVLAGYLARVCDGDPEGASRFDLGAVERENPHAQKLSRILGAYADALEDSERRVLSLLSTLPRGAALKMLETLMDERPLGAVTGTVDRGRRKDKPAAPNVRMQQVRTDLERLQRAGLVYSSRAAGPEAHETYSAHPFVKDYFKGFEGVVAVNRRMAELYTPSLTNRPGGLLAARDELDRFELLIEHLVLAEQRDSAYSIYQRQLGAYEHLAGLGEYVRGRRLLELVLGDAQPASYIQLRELGHYARAMGELDEAERCYGKAREIFLSETRYVSELHDEAEDYAALYLMRGLLPQAAMPVPLMGPSDRLASLIRFLRIGGAPAGIASVAAHYAPNLLCAPWPGAKRRQILAEQHRDEGPAPVKSARRLMPLEELVTAGTWAGLAHGYGAFASALVRAHLALPKDRGAAGAELARLQAWISSAGSGDLQLVLAVRHLASRVALTAGDLDTCFQEIRLGIQSADTCGFGLLAIDLRLMEARARLAAGDAGAVLALSDEILALAGNVACDYRWALADAWHLRAMAQAGTDRAGARLSAEQAVQLRMQLRHPGVAETTRLVRRLEQARHRPRRTVVAARTGAKPLSARQPRR